MVRVPSLFSDDPGARGRLYVETVFVDPAWQVSRFYLKAGGPIVDATWRSCLTGFFDFLIRGKAVARAECFHQDALTFDVPRRIQKGDFGLARVYALRTENSHVPVPIAYPA